MILYYNFGSEIDFVHPLSLSSCSSQEHMTGSDTDLQYNEPGSGAHLSTCNNLLDL